jgi:predicted nuclease of restriction endonuclease-like (RecB) superfamily
MTTDIKVHHHKDLSEIHQMIVDARELTLRQINHNVVRLYWDIGQYISNKMEQNRWGDGIVEELSAYLISQQSSGSRGFSARNLWRMKKFYETYRDYENLSAVLTEISWSNHLHILSKTKTIEEKEFYLSLCRKFSYSARDLEKLIDNSTFERTMIADAKLSTALTEFPHQTKGVFKDTYVFDFLDISEDHKENTLRKSLLSHLKAFLLELGPDFSFIGDEYVVQVGMKDFRIDLLMHHRGLNCLVAIELKTTEFQPEYIGKLEFYLEALDRDIKKPHENPSIGMLICRTKDEEVVKYALSRTASPTLIAEYEIKLIDKSLLRMKLHEINTQLNETEIGD